MERRREIGDNKQLLIGDGKEAKGKKRKITESAVPEIAIDLNDDEAPKIIDSASSSAEAIVSQPFKMWANPKIRHTKGISKTPRLRKMQRMRRQAGGNEEGREYWREIAYPPNGMESMYCE